MSDAIHGQDHQGNRVPRAASRAAGRGYGNGWGPDSAQETPPSRSELDRIESDLDELFAIKAAVEPPHSMMSDKPLRQRLWDVEDHWGLHDPAERQP